MYFLYNGCLDTPLQAHCLPAVGNFLVEKNRHLIGPAKLAVVPLIFPFDPPGE